VKLLLDENLSRRLVPALEALGEEEIQVQSLQDRFAAS